MIKWSTNFPRAILAPVASRPTKARTAAAPPRRDRGRARGAPIDRAILESVIAELSEHGVAALSFDRVAQRADVNKTSVYRRYPTKEALVGAALESVLVEASTQLPESATFADDLRAAARASATVVSSPEGRGLFRAAIESTGDAATRRVAALSTAPARGILERARARGEIRHDVDGRVLFGALVGAVIHRVMIERRTASRAWLDRLVDTLLRGAVGHRT